MKHTNGIKISTHLDNPLLLKNFPNAKFVESENIELEDHMIELNDKLSIQLCFYSQDYCLTKDNDDDTFSNWEFNDFNSAINQSIIQKERGTK